MKSPHLLSTAQSSQKGRFHHNISDIVSQYSTDSFMIAPPTNHALSVLADTHEVTIGIPLCSYPPGQVMILAQETPFTTSPTEPSVVHVSSPEIHFTQQSHSSQSYQLPPPSAIPLSVHTKRPQLCCSMLSCSAPCRNSLCFMLMSFEQAHNGST